MENQNSPSKFVYVDIETYSELDIRNVGSYVYGKHPSTMIVCMCLIDSHGEAFVYPIEDSFVAGMVHLESLIGEGARVVAHNAVFEYCVLKKYLVALELSSFLCTSHLSRFNGGPAGLNNCMHFWNIPEKKVETGTFLIKHYHKQIREGKGQEYLKSDEFKQLKYYCQKDTELCKELHQKILQYRLDLPEYEYNYWLDSHRVNENGIPVNLDKASKMLEVYNNFKDKIKTTFHDRYEFNPKSHKQTIEWLEKHNNVIKVYKRDKKSGEYKEKKSADIGAVNSNWKSLKPNVKKMFEFRSCFPPDQIKRLDKISKLNINGRLVGLLKHFGAITGRYTSKGFNVLNLPKSGKNIFEESETMYDFKWRTGKVLMESLRSVVEPEGHLIISDLSQIEFRLMMWFCGRDDVNKKLSRGEDIYLDFAEELFGFRPKKPSMERHIAKTGTLQLIYGSRAGQFRATLSKTFKDVPIDMCRKVYYMFHKRYPEIQEMFLRMSAFLNDGVEYRGKRYSLIEDYILLPSGRKIFVRDIDCPMDKNKYCIYDGITPYEVPPHTAANWLCQGTAREIIFLKQRQSLEQGLKVIFNEYDKLVVETTDEKLDEDMSKLSEIMKKQIDFLPDFVLDSDTESTKHYK